MSCSNSKAGHEYRKCTINGRGVHLGDHFGDAINNFYRLSRPVSEQLRNNMKAVFTSSQHGDEPLCRSGTHVEILQTFDEWAHSQYLSNVFWLHGMPGTGKTTIARTAAHDVEETEEFAIATWTFSQSDTTAGSAGVQFATDAKYLFSIFALQLMQYEHLEPYISKALRRFEEFEDSGLTYQWEKLILRPLKHAHEARRFKTPVLLFIDGLDKCQNHAQIRTILQILTSKPESRNAFVRFFITSRPERPIVDMLYGPKFVKDLDLDERDPARIRADFGRIAQSELPGLSQRDIDTVVYSADRSLIFLKQSCEALRRGGSGYFEEDWRKIMSSSKDAGDQEHPHWPTHKMEVEIYEKVLQDHLDQRTQVEQYAWAEKFRSLLGTMAVMLTPLPLEPFARLVTTGCGIEVRSCRNFMYDLRSLVTIPKDGNNPLRFIHSSFKKFILTIEPSSILAVSKDKSHAMLSKSCMEIMGTIGPGELRKLDQKAQSTIWTADSQGHQQSTTPLRHAVATSLMPLELRYAYTNWLWHFDKGGGCFSTERKDIIPRFFDWFLGLLYVDSWIGCYRTIQCFQYINAAALLEKPRSETKAMETILHLVNVLLETMEVHRESIQDRPWELRRLYATALKATTKDHLRNKPSSNETSQKNEPRVVPNQGRQRARVQSSPPGIQPSSTPNRRRAVVEEGCDCRGVCAGLCWNRDNIRTQDNYTSNRNGRSRSRSRSRSRVRSRDRDRDRSRSFSRNRTRLDRDDFEDPNVCISRERSRDRYWRDMDETQPAYERGLRRQVPDNVEPRPAIVRREPDNYKTEREYIRPEGYVAPRRTVIVPHISRYGHQTRRTYI